MPAHASLWVPDIVENTDEYLAAQGIEILRELTGVDYTVVVHHTARLHDSYIICLDGGLTPR